MNQNRATLYLAIGIVGLVLTASAVRSVTSYFSRAEVGQELRSIQIRQEVSPSPAPTLAPPDSDSQEQAFPRNLLGLCQDDADYDTRYDLNKDGCIRQNDWDLFGR